MLKVDNIQVFNFEGAFRGLRNPKDSWHLSDSNFNGSQPYIGPKDMDLAQRMIGAGTDESKFLRQIAISMDITAPLYWWKEFDTYKVGTVANSCSTMHKLDAYPITREMFSWDNEEEMEAEFWDVVDRIIAECERLRLMFKSTGEKKYWRALVQLLPESWMQKRTVTLNYQVARAMYFARRFHKLTEWHVLCQVFLDLPWGQELIAYKKPKGIDLFTCTILETLGIASKNANKEWRTFNEILDELKTKMETFGGNNED